MPLAVRRTLSFVALGLVAIALVACEKPDASDVTSPSARLLLGTTTGNVSYAPEGEPPAPVPATDPWDFELGNVRFSELENGTPALQIVTLVESQPGTGLELWITGENGPLMRWSGGSTREFDGTFCFQLRLEDDDEALPMHVGEHYEFTMTFRDFETGDVVVSDTIRIAGFPPEYDAAPPGEDSRVARDLLGCPRAPI